METVLILTHSHKLKPPDTRRARRGYKLYQENNYKNKENTNFQIKLSGSGREETGSHITALYTS